MEDISEYHKDLNTTTTNNFGIMYGSIAEELDKQKVIGSRAGQIKEILNFKTTITNPRRRCVNRPDINIFFLLAESLWIFAGRDDVEFLEKFNSRMKDYSDDEKTFHGAYGKRIRSWKTSVKDTPLDQLELLVDHLAKEPNSRRAVVSIWNPELDLDTTSKDLPCNSMLMYKIRDGELHCTIQNRSNDVHWGLPTNVFQFSFLNEIIAECLGVDLGTQTHNSQSLHVYIENPLVKKFQEDRMDISDGLHKLYIECEAVPMNLVANKGDKPATALSRYTEEVKLIIDALNTDMVYTEKDAEKVVRKIKNEYFLFIFFLLKIYLDYKKGLKDYSELNTAENSVKNEMRITAMERISSLTTKILPQFAGSDYEILALKFFVDRITDESLKQRLIYYKAIY